ncbi:MAG: hypothetical protein ABII10_03000 [Candidatus Paceibacterota bacterium]
MEIFYTEFFNKKLIKLTARNSRLEHQLKKQIELLRFNPDHPSLKLHKLQGTRRNYYAIWIEKNLRVVFTFTSRGILLGDLLAHDEY